MSICFYVRMYHSGSTVKAAGGLGCRGGELAPGQVAFADHTQPEVPTPNTNDQQMQDHEKKHLWVR